MELIPDQAYATKLLSRIRVDTVGAKPMPHLTELIYCLTKSYWSRRDKTGMSTFLDDKTILLFAIGRGLEEAMIRPSGSNEQGQLDGIHYEIDLVEDDGDWTEFKTTRMGPKRIATEGIPWGWQRQLLGYLHILWAKRGKPKQIPVSRISILHIIPVELFSWRVKVSAEDLELNWQWLQERKATYLHFIEAGEAPPPFTYNEAWECDGCFARLICNIDAARLGILEPEVKAAMEAEGPDDNSD